MNAETRNPDFAQDARFQTPARQGSGFGLRRAWQWIKRGLRPLLSLCFLNQTGWLIRFSNFQPSTLDEPCLI